MGSKTLPSELLMILESIYFISVWTRDFRMSRACVRAEYHAASFAFESSTRVTMWSMKVYQL